MAVGHRCPGRSGAGPRTIWVSVDAAGHDADSYSIRPSISGDGRYVAFQSHASDLVPDDER